MGGVVALSPPPPSLCVGSPGVAPRKREEGGIEREYLEANTFSFSECFFKI